MSQRLNEEVLRPSGMVFTSATRPSEKEGYNFLAEPREDRMPVHEEARERVNAWKEYLGHIGYHTGTLFGILEHPNVLEIYKQWALQILLIDSWHQSTCYWWTAYSGAHNFLSCFMSEDPEARGRVTRIFSGLSAALKRYARKVIDQSLVRMQTDKKLEGEAWMEKYFYIRPILDLLEESREEMHMMECLYPVVHELLMIER